MGSTFLGRSVAGLLAVVLMVGVADGHRVSRAYAGQATPAPVCSGWVAVTDWGTCVNERHTRAERISCDGVEAFRIVGGDCVTVPASNVATVESVGTFADSGDGRVVLRVPKGARVVVAKSETVTLSKRWQQ